MLNEYELAVLKAVLPSAAIVAKGVTEKFASAIIGVTTGIFKPFQIERLARANASKLIIEAESKNFIDMRNAQVEAWKEAYKLEKRAELRNSSRIISEQENLENIARIALLNYGGQQETEEPVSVDWLNDFADTCKTVSDLQMQELWAKILAGEIARPGTFSRRTIAALKLLTHSEATLFKKLCEMAISWQNINFVMTYPVNHFTVKNHKPYRHLLFDSSVYERYRELQIAGLIKEMRHDLANTPYNVSAKYFDVIFEVSNYKPGNRVGYIYFTEVGNQLYTIAGAAKNAAYVASFLQSFNSVSSSVRYRIENDDPWQIFEAPKWEDPYLQGPLLDLDL